MVAELSSNLDVRQRMADGPLPPPWRADKMPGGYVVRDANGQPRNSLCSTSTRLGALHHRQQRGGDFFCVHQEGGWPAPQIGRTLSSWANTGTIYYDKARSN
jgi:hypothetical protein